MALYTANTERLRITADGNVGIGTGAPIAGTLLDVRGSIHSSTYFWNRIASSEATASRGLLFTIDGIDYGRIYSPNGKSVAIQAGIGTLADALTIDQTGNVGIGTTTPAERLHVSGNIRMTGNLQRAAPVTVAASTHTLAETTSWLIVNNAGTCTVTLPAASTWTGRELTIKTITANAVISASSNVVPIDGDTAGTAILPATDGAWAKLVSDGTNWIIMQRG